MSFILNMEDIMKNYGISEEELTQAMESVEIE